MNQFFHKHRTLALLPAIFYVLFSVWTLAARLISMLLTDPAALEAFRQTESILSAGLFAFLPCIFFFLCARDCRDNAKTALYAAAAARLMALAGYCISASDADSTRLLSLVFCLSLGSAVLEIVLFALTACILRKNRAESICAWIAAGFTALHHAICLTELFAGIRLVGTGSVVKWLRILAYASSAEFFTAIIKGAFCALVFFLIYEARRAPIDPSGLVHAPARGDDAASEDRK